MPIRVRRDSVRSDAIGKSTGFTLIELMIVVAVIAVILTVALPVYTTYTIRAKVGEALAVADAAKTAVAATCVEDLLLTDLTNSKAGYSFTPSKWVQSVNISGDCTEPVVKVSTQTTGAPSDPDIVLSGEFATSNQRITWVCTSNAEDRLLPAECRSED
jgi:type IV pilus assembly protein PilA